MVEGGRSDARRNRDLVLQAAEAIFGEHGTEASTEAVARQAGVGIATVFRHFPTKRALVEAVVMRRLERLLDTADSIVDTGAPTGLFELFGKFVDEGAGKRVFGDVLAGADPAYKAANAAIVAALRDRYAVLLERAQHAGLVRADVDLQDIRGLLAGAHHALALFGDEPERRLKLVDIMTTGLRP